MKISLILATKDRVKDVEKFIASVEEQKYEQVQLLIIDQNKDNRLTEVVNRYSSRVLITHLKSDPGLSKARNIGLKHLEDTDIVAFPDDDCIYPKGTLERVVDYFKTNSDAHGLTGRSIDNKSNTSAGNFSGESGQVDLFNVWKQGISFTIFIKKEVVARIGNFDEKLGVGSRTPWGSGEETDYLIRAIRKNFKIYYDSGLKIIHPNPTIKMNKKAYKRAYSYGAGMGRVLNKNKYPIWFKVKMLSRSLAGVLVSLMKFNIKKSYFYLNSLLGRIKGTTSKVK